MTFLKPFTYLLFIIVSMISTVNAAESCDPDNEQCVEVGRWDVSLGLGAGIRTNPVENAADIPLILLPQISYNGKRFFLQNLDAGFILHEADRHQLSLFVTPSFDQVFFRRWNPGNFFADNTFGYTGNTLGAKEEDPPLIDQGTDGFVGPSEPEPTVNKIGWRDLKRRHTAGLAGLEYNWASDVLDIQLHYLSDFTHTHSGDEIRIVLAKHWLSGKHRLSAALGANWQSREVINYYYGIHADESDETYTASSGVSAIARVDWSYELTSHWDLRFWASYRRLPHAIAASPIVSDDKVMTAFAGGVYHF